MQDRRVHRLFPIPDTCFNIARLLYLNDAWVGRHDLRLRRSVEKSLMTLGLIEAEHTFIECLGHS